MLFYYHIMNDYFTVNENKQGNVPKYFLVFYT